MRARIGYINYTNMLRIFNILNLFCLVYIDQALLAFVHSILSFISGCQMERLKQYLCRKLIKIVDKKYDFTYIRILRNTVFYLLHVRCRDMERRRL